MRQSTLKVIVLDKCNKELELVPNEILKEFQDALLALAIGLTLSMPLSRAISNIARGTFELRFQNKEGAFRVVYFVKKKEAIYVIHAFCIKTQKMPLKNIAIIRKRIRELL